MTKCLILWLSGQKHKSAGASWQMSEISREGRFEHPLKVIVHLQDGISARIASGAAVH